MHYLNDYKTYETVEQLNASVNTHIQHAKLKGNERLVLLCLARHSLRYPGACQLKACTIANEVGISRSTVTRIVKSLLTKNIIASHRTTKRNGIKGANIYTILLPSATNASHEIPSQTFFEPSNEPSGMSHRANAANRCAVSSGDPFRAAESVSFKQPSNNFEYENVLYVYTPSLKDTLKQIYEPSEPQHSAAFNELCKIAFGRLKQCMRKYGVPYTQMCDIVIRCMHQLVNKRDVRNTFALYSAMIERQVKQLFEEPIVQRTTGRVEMLPSWFHEQHGGQMPQQDAALEEDRQRVLAKIAALHSSMPERSIR